MPVLYYVRHGETDFNAEARLQGRRDTELNAVAGSRLPNAAGCCTICSRAIGRRAADFAYVASPLKRARRNHGNPAHDARP